MKWLPLIWIPILMLGSCNFFTEYVEGDGNVIVRHISTEDFREIELAGIGRVVITQGDSCDITVIAEENIIEHMKIYSSGESLVISQDEWVVLRPRHEPVFLVTMPEIRRLHITGAGNIVSDGFITGDSIQIILEGAGDIQASLDVSEIIAVLSGAGGITMNGSAAIADLSITGSGNISAGNLYIDYCSAVIPGSGNIEVWVGNRLDAIIYGSGNIFYDGPAIVDARIYGSGSVISR